nr:PAS domain S-box protein [Deinococcus sp. JMULE3]
MPAPGAPGRRRWPLSLLLLIVVLIVTLGAFAFTFARLNRVASLSSVSITGWAYAEFVRQAAEMRVLVARVPAPDPAELEVPLAVLQSKATVVSGEPLLDRIDRARRAELLEAVAAAQALTLADLRGPEAAARLAGIMDRAQEGYAGAVDLLGRERSAIARDLRVAEVTLAALAALLALTIATVILQLQARARRDLRLETERRAESERARGVLERTTRELLAAEGALQRERDFAVQVMEAMGEGLYVTGADGTFEYVNPALARMVGQPPGALVGHAESEVLADVMGVPSAPGGARVTVEVPLRRPDGASIPALLTRVTRAGGGVTAVLTDLSAPKMAEARLRELYEVTARGAPDTVGELLEVAARTFRAPGAFVRGGVIVACAGPLSAERAQVLAAQPPGRTPDTLRVAVRAPDGPGTLVFCRSGGPIFTAADEDFLRLIGQWLEQDAAREETARQLRRSEELNKAVIRSSLDAIITCDGRGTVTEFNPAAEQIFGLDRAAALGQPLDTLIIPERLRAAHGLSLQRLSAGGPGRILGQRLELPAVRRDGQEFPVELSVVRLPTVTPEYAGFVRDITDRRAAEARLQHRTTQLDSVFNVSPDGFVTFGDQGQVVEVNPAFLALTGTTREELLGLSEAQFERVLRSRCEVARPAGRPPPGVDVLQVVRPARRVLKRTRRAMDAGDGVVLGHVMYFRDITHEAEISNMKSEFMSTAAHELRTPMTSIYGFTELLLTRDLDAETTRDLLETIYRQAGRLILLLTELLDLARIEARAGQDFRIVHEAVRPLIETTVQAFTPPHERPRVRVQVAPNLPLLPVDAAKFSQALGNVLSNAFKYSPQGGEVLVHAWMDPLHPLLHVSVTDQGLGMTPEQLHRAFERFYRAESSGSIPGTGLGLSLVQEIMHCHGGRATLSSEPGQGSVVTLTFPVSPASQQSAPQESHAQEDPDRG